MGPQARVLTVGSMDLGTNPLGHTGVCDQKIEGSSRSNDYKFGHTVQKSGGEYNKSHLLLTNFLQIQAHLLKFLRMQSYLLECFEQAYLTTFTNAGVSAKNTVNTIIGTT